MVRPESSTGPAGVSPVHVRTGTPGSRPPARIERSAVEAGCREPLRREQERGPQHEVNPAASSQKQWEGRAAHVTVKAISAAGLRPAAVGLPGVWGTARAHGSVGNRRDPSAPPESGQGRSYKPMVKSSGAQRESEGVVVPGMGVQHNAPGGKGPCFGRARDGGTRKGMVRSTGPNDPGGHSPIVSDGLSPVANARRLPGELCAAAERRSARRHQFPYTSRWDVTTLRGSRCSGDSTMRMPRAKAIGKPDAGKRHVRFERGSVETGRFDAVPRH